MKKLIILLLLAGAVLGGLWLQGYIMAGNDLKNGTTSEEVNKLTPVGRHGYNMRMKSNSHYRKLETDVNNAVSK